MPYQKYDIKNGNIVGVYDDKSEENIGKQNSEVLRLFEINNKNHAFDSVNCVAYDIYRIPEKKNNKRHKQYQILKILRIQLSV